VNLLEDNIDTIKKNTETLIDVSKEVGLEINVDKTKYMLLCGLVVRVLDYRYRGPGFESRALQKKSSGSGTGSTQPREYN
jgi:hypothetical protein